MDAVVRQKIRTVSVRPPAEIDEQRWPIHALIVVCVALVGWWSLRSSSFQFDEVPFWENGYVRLGLLAALLILLFGAVRWLEQRVRRRVQLCALFSLTVHLVLLLYLEQSRLLVKALWPAFSKKAPEVHVPVVIPDYGVELDARSSRPTEPFELPLEVALPPPQVDKSADISPEASLPEFSREPLEAQVPQPRPLQPAEVLRDFVPWPSVGEFGANTRFPVPERKTDLRLRAEVSPGEVNLPQAKEPERQIPSPTAVLPNRVSPQLARLEQPRREVTESAGVVRKVFPLVEPEVEPIHEFTSPEPTRISRPTRFRNLPQLVESGRVDSSLLKSADSQPMRSEGKLAATPLPPVRRLTATSIPRDLAQSAWPQVPRPSSQSLVSALNMPENYDLTPEPAQPPRPERARSAESIKLAGAPEAAMGMLPQDSRDGAKTGEIGPSIPTVTSRQVFQFSPPSELASSATDIRIPSEVIRQRGWNRPEELWAINSEHINRPLVPMVAEAGSEGSQGDVAEGESLSAQVTSPGASSPGRHPRLKRGAVLGPQQLAAGPGLEGDLLASVAVVGSGSGQAESSDYVSVVPPPESDGRSEGGFQVAHQTGPGGALRQTLSGEWGDQTYEPVGRVNLAPMSLEGLSPGGTGTEDSPEASANEGGVEEAHGPGGVYQPFGERAELRPRPNRTGGSLPSLQPGDSSALGDVGPAGGLGPHHFGETKGNQQPGSEIPAPPTELLGRVSPGGWGPQSARRLPEEWGGTSGSAPVSGFPNPALPGTPWGDSFASVPHSSVRRPAGKLPGGLPALGGTVRSPVQPGFARRQPGQRREFAEKYGGSAATESAVERGLAFLSRYQFPDGRWRFDAVPPGMVPFPELARYQFRADTAATALAILAFLGAGYTHLEGQYQSQVTRGLEWLLQVQQPDGSLFSPETEPARGPRMYAHGIATIALCEAYGMTQDPPLKAPAEKAVQFILQAQDPRFGGWRYTKHPDRSDWVKESDTSVSGWQLLALRSAQLAGLSVPRESLAKVNKWLDVASLEQGAKYCYSPFVQPTPESPDPRQPSLAMTAEGLLMRLLLGWNRNIPQLQEGAKFLTVNPPVMDVRSPAERDAYYWYYATQVLFHLQGDWWQRWNQKMQEVLLPTQLAEGPFEGSWDPLYPVPDRWAHAGGRIYVTALHLLMLEVYYRHLPLFENLASGWEQSPRR